MKMWCIYTTKYYSAVKNIHKIMRFSSEWMELKNYSEWGKPDPNKQIVSIFSYMWMAFKAIDIHATICITTDVRYILYENFLSKIFEIHKIMNSVYMCISYFSYLIALTKYPTKATWREGGRRKERGERETGIREGYFWLLVPGDTAQHGRGGTVTEAGVSW